METGNLHGCERAHRHLCFHVACVWAWSRLNETFLNVHQMVVLNSKCINVHPQVWWCSVSQQCSNSVFLGELLKLMWHTNICPELIPNYRTFAYCSESTNNIETVHFKCRNQSELYHRTISRALSVPSCDRGVLSVCAGCLVSTLHIHSFFNLHRDHAATIILLWYEGRTSKQQCVSFGLIAFLQHVSK